MKITKANLYDPYGIADGNTVKEKTMSKTTDISKLRKAWEAWSKEGRTVEQMYGALIFLTSKHITAALEAQELKLLHELTAPLGENESPDTRVADRALKRIAELSTPEKEQKR